MHTYIHTHKQTNTIRQPGKRLTAIAVALVLASLKAMNANNLPANLHPTKWPLLEMSSVYQPHKVPEAYKVLYCIKRYVQYKPRANAQRG